MTGAALPAPSFRFAFPFAWLLLAGLAAPAGAAPTALLCTATQGGKAVINEVQTNNDFVEIYLKAAVDILNWALYVDAAKVATLGTGTCRINGSTTPDNASSGATATSWPAGTFIVCDTNMNPSNNEALLVDKNTPLGSLNATVIDYLSYGIPTPAPKWLVPLSCGTLYPLHNSGNQGIARIPDGSGPLADNGDNSTRGTSNSGGGGAPAPGGFNAFDTGTTPFGSIGGYVKTKPAGTAFALSIVVLDAARTALYGSTGNGYAGTVKVELLGNTDTGVALDGNHCPTGSTVLHAGTLTFAAGDSSRKDYGFPAVGGAWRNARARISYPATGAATTIACATDNFAIRPASFGSPAATDATWTTTGTARPLDNTGGTGGVVHAAGRPFTLTASALDGTGSVTANYAGTATIVRTACPLPSGCAVGAGGTYAAGTFSPATLAASGGILADAGVSYSETGTVTIQLVDDSFAAVDAADGSTADCAGRHICSAAVTIGRFVPDRFELSLNDAGGTPYPAPRLQTFGNACASRAFTYVGQPFGYATVPKVLASARAAGGTITANYRGFDSPPAVTVTQTYTATPASPAFDASAQGTPLLTANHDGTAELAMPAGASFRFTRGGPVAPFTAAIGLALAVADATEAAVTGNGTIQTGAAANFAPLAFDAGDAFRYGRLRLLNQTGSELLRPRVEFRAEYWDGGRWATNTLDACTPVAAANIAAGGLTVNNLTALAGGIGFITFNTAAAGSYDLAIDLNASGADTSCNAGHGGTAANQPWLQGHWSAPANCGGVAAWAQDPNARVRLGSPRAPYLYLRERY